MTKQRGPLKARVEKARTSSNNKLVRAIGYLPQEVKRIWVEKFREDAEVAFHSLLTGASHICPACGHNCGPRFACNCDRPNVHAVRLYCELDGSVGTPGQVLIGLWNGLGVKGEDDAREKIKAGTRLMQLRDAGVSARESFESAMDLLRLSFMEEPGLRNEALTRLGGESIKPILNGNMNGESNGKRESAT